MNTRLLPALVSLLLLAATVRAEETFDDAMKRATADYGERLRKAADELNSTRTRIADEKAPLLKEMRLTEDRIVTAQSQIERLEAGREDYSEQRRKFLMELDATRKNSAYIGTLAHDGMTAFEESLNFIPALLYQFGNEFVVLARVRCADDMGDAVSDGHFGHGFCGVERVCAVIEARKYVGMNINH